MANLATPDAGELKRFNIAQDSNWEFDEEPVPSPNDTHARFSLADKIRIKVLDSKNSSLTKKKKKYSVKKPSPTKHT